MRDDNSAVHDARPDTRPRAGTSAHATLCWMDERQDLDPATAYVLQHTTQRAQAYVNEVLYELDVNSLHRNKADTHVESTEAVSRRCLEAITARVSPDTT